MIKKLKKLESLTTLFLDYAEDMANEHNPMMMQKWIDATDDLLKFRKKNSIKRRNMKNLELNKIKNIYRQWMNYIKDI